jgi:hypothetical protein
MKRALTLFLAALVLGPALAPGAAPQGDQGKPTLTPYQVIVRRKIDAKDFPPDRVADARTHARFLARVPGKVVLRLDQSSKLTAFGDDKGASLLDARDPTSAVFYSGLLTTDGSGMMIGVASSRHAPTAGATAVIVKGSLVLACGLDEKTIPDTKVDFKAQGDSKLGVLTLRAGVSKGANPRTNFELTGAVRSIKELLVLDGDGKEVSVLTSSIVAEAGGGLRFSYFLSREVARGSVRVVYYAAEEKVTVPVDLTIAVGL